MNIQTMTAQEILDPGVEIRIVSGEALSAIRVLLGTRTIRALKSA